MRKSDSWLTVSTSGELFMMVLTLARGRFTLAAKARGVVMVLVFMVKLFSSAAASIAKRLV